MTTIGEGRQEEMFEIREMNPKMLLSTPENLQTEFDRPDFKGYERIDKETLPKEVQGLCDALGAKLARIYRGGLILTQIMLRDDERTQLQSFAQIPKKELDYTALMHYLQFRLLSTLYPNHNLVRGTTMTELNPKTIKDNLSVWMQDREVILFPAPDDEKGIAPWFAKKKANAASKK